MKSVEWIGWFSSFFLLATIVKQLHKQWSEKTSAGVSRWLFGGQVAAEIGFIIYSVLLDNWIFAVTNILLLIANIVGLMLTLKFRRTSAN